MQKILHTRRSHQIQKECGAYERESNECVDKDKLIIFDRLEGSGKGQARGHHEFQNRLPHTLLLRAAPKIIIEHKPHKTEVEV